MWHFSCRLGAGVRFIPTIVSFSLCIVKCLLEGESVMGRPVGGSGMPVLACQAVNISWVSSVGNRLKTADFLRSVYLRNLGIRSDHLTECW